MQYSFSLQQIAEIIAVSQHLQQEKADRRQVMISDGAKFADAMASFGLDRNRPGYFGRNFMHGNRIRDNGGLSDVAAVGEFLRTQLGEDAYTVLSKNPKTLANPIDDLKNALAANGLLFDAQGKTIQLTISPDQQAAIELRAAALHKASPILRSLDAVCHPPNPRKLLHTLNPQS